MATITIDDLKIETGVTDSQLNQRCDKEHLKSIAPKVENFIRFASEFNIPEGTMSGIKIDDLSFQQKTEKIFLWWTNNSRNATYKSFVLVCIKVCEGDIAREMCKLCATLELPSLHMSGPSFICPTPSVERPDESTLKQNDDASPVRKNPKHQGFDISATVSPFIEMEGESYSLNKIPGENSAIVLAEKKQLLRVIDLKILVDDLGRVGGFIRVAYNAVGAAGPRFTEQQIQIQRLGYNITKLCDKSALTVAKFQNASSRILTYLQSIYEYLLDNMEEMAVGMLSDVSKLAGDMQRAALELKKEFEEEATKVKMTLEDTQKSEGKEALRIEELKKEQIAMEEEKQRLQTLMGEYQQKENEAKSRRRDLEQQEDQTLSAMGDINPLKELANAVTSIFGVKICSAEKKAKAVQQARREALEAEQAVTEKRHELLTRMTSCVTKIKQFQDDEKMGECAIEALHEAIGALRKLSLVMMQAATFWEQVQNHCKSLAESELKSSIEKALSTYAEEKRLKVWTSSAFKIQAVHFYAGWVALNSVCAEYMQKIKETQEDLYRYIAENPTWEESRSNLKGLVEKFLTDLKHDKDALADKSFKAQEEINSLSVNKDDTNKN